MKPTPPATRAKRGKIAKAQWGIWIPYNSGVVAKSSLAKVNGLRAYFKVSDLATVRKLRQ